MSFKVTITNNETGAVLVNEENAVAIVGAIGNGQGNRSIGFTACDAISIGSAISEAEDVISQLKTDPRVKLVLELKALMDKEMANYGKAEELVNLGYRKLPILTEQEKEIEQLTRECNQQAETLAEEQEACVECELEQSWELFARDKEIDRLRAESKRFENNMKSVPEIEKKNVVKEFAEKLKVNAICLSAIEKYHVCNLIDKLLKEYEK